METQLKKKQLRKNKERIELDGKMKTIYNEHGRREQLDEVLIPVYFVILTGFLVFISFSGNSGPNKFRISTNTNYCRQLPRCVRLHWRASMIFGTEFSTPGCTYTRMNNTLKKTKKI